MADDAKDLKRKNLRVALFADDELFCESIDAELWHATFAAIYGLPQAGKQLGPMAPSGNASSGGRASTTQPVQNAVTEFAPQGTPLLEAFAKEIGVDVALLQGACDPSDQEPYIVLDHDSWEVFKTQLGSRGRNAVSPIAAAATLLGLWFRHLNLGNPTISQAQAVLNTIGIRDANAARGINRSDWLQPRPSGQVIINPAKNSKAKTFAACFCNNEWTTWNSA